MRFVYEESIAAQCGHGNDALRCTRDGECDLEILVIRRMGNDGEPLAGQRPDERRMQRSIMSAVGNAQVATGKLAARERFVRGPRPPVDGCTSRSSAARTDATPIL